MPILADAPSKDSLLKLLLIADSKSGKTPWSGMAAMTHNVLYLDGDVGIQSLNAYLPNEAKQRLVYMNVSDYVDEKGVYVSRFAEFFTSFCTEGTYTWNDTRGETFARRSYVVGESTDDVWQIRPAKMDHTCILILDSWTALATSVMQMLANAAGIDLADQEKVDRGIYAGAGNKMTMFLTMLKNMPCHVIVIAHPDEYVKYESPSGMKVGAIKEVDRKVVFTKMVPKSTSRPHALTMAKFFSDVGWLDTAPNGQTNIDFKPSNERIIGGHLNDRRDAKTTTPADLIKIIGGFIPSQPSDFDWSSWLTIHKSGSFEPAGGAKLALGAKPEAQPPNNGKLESASIAPPIAPSTVKIGGLGALMNRNKEVDK